MASPFNIFRKRQKLMLAILGVLAMLAFVVLPPLLQSQGQRAVADDPEVARTNYGTLRRSDVGALLNDQAIARSFAASLAEAADDPFVQFQVQQRIQQQWGDGRDERFAVQRMLLARKAEEMGMAVGNDEVQQFIRDLTGDKVTADQLAEIFRRFEVPQARVFDALRRELLADRLQTLFVSYFSPNEHVIATPAEQWDYYRRLNRRVQAEVAALPTSRFVDDVPDPSDEELEAYFAKYADRLPDKLSPEPGFRIPLKAAFTYLKADFDKAVEAAQVTDEEIAAYYEKNRDFYKNPELPFPEEGREERSTLPDFRLPESLDSGADVGDSLRESQAGADEPPAEDNPPSDGEDALPGSQDGADDAPADEPADETDAPDSASSDETETGDDCQPADETEEEAAAVGDSLRESQEAGDDAPANEDAADDEPADADDAATEAQPSQAADETADVGDSLRESPDSASAGDGTDAAAQPGETIASDLPVREDLDAPPPTRPVYKPLSEVRDQIRNTLKRTKARDELDTAVKAVTAEMNAYYQQLLVSRAGQQDAPQLPDLQALAASHHMTLHETGLLSRQEVFDQVDLGKSFVVGQQMLYFTDYAYLRLQEFQPGATQDDAASRYVFWKTREEEEKASSLADGDTRRHVVRTWKLEQARDLARKRADELAERAGKSSGSLREALAGEAGIEIVETGEFTWMTDPFGQGQPRLSEVHGVAHAGPDFMRSVFALAAGEVGVAANEPQDTLYVVRLASSAPSTDVLRSMFAATQFDSYQQVAYGDFREVLFDWARQVSEEAGLEWLPQAEPEPAETY